jgi:hypothetical protein
MDHRLKLSIALAAPLAAVGVACAWILMQPSTAPPTIAADAPPALVEHCKLAAELLYEVSWAAACMRGDDKSNDCTLPDSQAAKVNAILDTEEARCMASEMQARASP